MLPAEKDVFHAETPETKKQTIITREQHVQSTQLHHSHSIAQ